MASFTGKMAFDKMSKENQDRLTATKTEEDVALLMKEFVE